MKYKFVLYSSLSQDWVLYVGRQEVVGWVQFVAWAANKYVACVFRKRGIESGSLCVGILLLLM